MNQPESAGQPFRHSGASRYLSTASIAARLNITTRSIRLWAECGELPAVKFGRQWRFEQQAFEEWLAVRIGERPVRPHA
jgi:excisionase family DNA binding protein